MARKAAQNAWADVELNVLEILLDLQNPRVEIPPKASQPKIREILLVQEDVAGLARSIVDDNGILPGENIIVVVEDGRHVVVEGNRRVCACQLLVDPDLRPAGHKKGFPTATPELQERIKRLKAVVAPNRDATERPITKKHTEPGVRPWTPIAKQRRIARLIQAGRTTKDVAEQFGMQVSSVKRLARDYNLLKRVNGLKAWSKDERENLAMPDLKVNPFTRLFQLFGGKETLRIEFSDDGTFTSTLDDKLLDDALERIGREMLFGGKGSLNTRATPLEVFGKVFAGHKELESLLPGNPPTTNPSDAPTGASASAGTSGSSSGKTSSTGAMGDGSGSASATGSGAPSVSASAGTSVGTGPAAGTSTRVKVKAKADEFFSSLVCHISDDGLVRITKEISSINYKAYPTAATFLLRALIERTFNWCIDEKKLRPTMMAELAKPGKPPKDPGLEDIIRFCMRHHTTIFSEPRLQSVLNYLMSEKTVLDLVIHGRWMHADETKLRTVASHSRPCIQKILDRSALAP